MDLAPPSLRARLDALRSRGEIKRLGEEIDREPALEAAFRALALLEGIVLEPDMGGKRLVRALLQRADSAQVRKNPIRVDEAFTCLCCGAEVPLGGARVRDHCPRCLRSRHLDVVPGDRAADCGGLLDPIGFERGGEDIHILYRCRACDHRWRARAHPDDAVPLDFDPARLPACRG